MLPAKKGPKGICDLIVFLPAIIRPRPIIAPEIKAKNKANKILGQPRTRPIKTANLTSPKPNHLPLEIRTSEKKKALAKRADNKYGINPLTSSGYKLLPERSEAKSKAVNN